MSEDTLKDNSNDDSFFNSSLKEHLILLKDKINNNSKDLNVSDYLVVLTTLYLSQDDKIKKLESDLVESEENNKNLREMLKKLEEKFEGLNDNYLRLEKRFKMKNY